MPNILLEVDIEKAIAFNDQLKNNMQRRAMKAEMLQDQKYVEVLTELQALQDRRLLLLIELQLLQNQFALGKLDIQASITLQETALAA